MHVPHILLTALGAVARETTYELNGRSVQASLTPLALVQLLPEDARPNRVLALVTAGAGETTWPLFAEGVREILGFDAGPVHVPDGRNADEIRTIIEKAAGCFPEEAALTLDVTQGLRHFPFIAYALVLYLTSLRGIRLRGAYYGMVEAPRDSVEPRPIVDLRPLLELPEWFHAVRVFRETGAARSLYGLADGLAAQLSRESARDGRDRDRELDQTAKRVRKLADTMTSVSAAYESALPVELGQAAGDFTRALSAEWPQSVLRRLPLAADLVALIGHAFSMFQSGPVPGGAGPWKSRVALDGAELGRQAAMIDLYLERDQLPLALGLMREWVVSFVLLKRGHGEHWLDNAPDGHRSTAERRLGAIAALVRSGSGLLTDEQKNWGKFWNGLTTIRNNLHHHGMGPDVVKLPPGGLEKVRTFWDDLKQVDSTAVPELGGGQGRLLITALGTTPGVLYSALLHAGDARRCLLVCSEQSRASVPEVVERTGWRGEICELAIADPHGGYTPEEAARFRSHSSRWLLDADEVVANLTGGTTLMGMAVQNLMDRGRALDRICRRFVLIDRRPPDVQRSDPYVQSEIRWLDEAAAVT